MKERLEKELELLHQFYPGIVYKSNGHWFYIPSYPLPLGWNRKHTEVAFQLKKGYPGTKPYGFYTPKGIRFNNQKPQKYKEPANNQPPFEGEWGQFSWSIKGSWKPASDIIVGSNLVNWMNSFRDRFNEGV